MTIGSCFSGIGGELVAASMLGWDVKFFCEKNPFGNRVLSYWYPNAKNYEDITTADFTEWRGRVDVLTGGFPCQPFSYAGRRRGAEDDRYLWPAMHNAIDEIQPTWVVAENVAGILTMVEQGEVSKVAGSATLFDAFDDLRGRFELRETFTLQRICTDLESHGYAVQPVLVPACAVGAPHRRDRVFIVARRVEAVSEDTMHGGQLHRPNEEQGSERNERNTCAGGGERICGETSGTVATDTLLRGSVSPRPREASEGDGIEELSQSDGQGQRFAPCGDSRLSRLSRNAPHPDSHRGSEVDEHMESELADGAKPVSNGGQRNVADTERPIADPRSDGRPQEDIRRESRGRTSDGKDDEQPQSVFNRAGHGAGEWGDYCGERWQNFPSVSPVHRGNDGLPFDVDRLTLSFGKWRTEALKAYGNAIVPQVMYEIFRAIEIVEQQNNEI